MFLPVVAIVWCLLVLGLNLTLEPSRFVVLVSALWGTALGVWIINLLEARRRSHRNWPE